MENKYINDSLWIGVDISSKERPALVVTRRHRDEIYVINMITDEEAVEIYNKLIGNNEFKKHITDKYIY